MGETVKQITALVSVPALILGIMILVGSAWTQSGPLSTPFPSQHAKEIKWFDSLTKGIHEASAAKKPICLILAGERPSGDC